MTPLSRGRRVPGGQRSASRLALFGSFIVLSACAFSIADKAEPPLPEVVLPAPQPAAARMSASPFAAYVRGAVLAGPGAEASVARVALARAELDAARNAYVPRLSLALGAAAGQAEGAASYGIVPGLQLAQTVFDGGAGRMRSQAAAARLVEVEAEQAIVFTRLAFSVIEAMAELELAERLAALSEEDRLAHEELVSGIRQRLEAGAGTEGETLTAIGRLQASEAAAIAARGAARSARARLDELAGQSRPEPPVLPQAPVLEDIPIGGQSTAELSARIVAVTAASLELGAARARGLPGAELSVSLSRPGRGEDIRQSAGLDVGYEVDAAGRRSAAIAGAAARLAQAEADLEIARRAALRQDQTMLDELETARATAEAARSAAQTQRSAFAVTETEVSLGRRASTALLDARRDLTQAERALVQAEIELRLAGWRSLAIDARLLSALGLPLPGAAPVVGVEVAP
jgi:outer membrane protein TolC